MSRLFLITFLLIVTTHSAISQSESYYSNGYKIDYFTHKDGLSNWEIADVIQDKKGNLWMSSMDQLVKYNGYEFQKYQPLPDSLIKGPQKFLWRLCEDEYGNIWASTFGGGLLKFDPVLERFNRFTSFGQDTLAKMDNWITKFQVIDSTKIIAGALTKTFQFDITKDESLAKDGIKVKDRLSNIYTSFKDSKEDIWLLGNNQLERLKASDASATAPFNLAQSFLHLIQPDTTKNILVTWITESKKGGYWVLYREQKKEGGYQSAIGLLNLDLNTFSKVNFDPMERLCNILVEGPNGNLWVGTWGNGLYKLAIENENSKNGKDIAMELIPLIKNDYTDDFYIRGLQVDHSGNVWVGTRNDRLFKIDLVATSKLKYLELNIDSLNSRNNLFGLMEDHQGNVWAGLTNGKVLKIDANFRDLEIIEPTRTNGYITYPLKQIDDKIWFSGGENKNSLVVNNLKNEVIATYTLPDSLIAGNYNFTKLYKGKEDFLWLVYGEGQVFKFDLVKKKFTFYYGNKFYGATTIISTFKYKEEIYYGTVEGRIGKLDEIGQDTGQIVDFKFPLADFFPSENGDLWVISTFGLSKFDRESNKQKMFDKEDNMGSKVYASLLEDVEGNIWLFSEEGIKKFDPIVASFSSYSSLSGVEPTPYVGQTVLLSQNNQIVFLGKKGIYSFDPAKIKQDSLTPNIHISNFWINNTALKDIDQEQAVTFSLGNPLSLTYDNNDIDIQYTGIDYRNRKATYAYQLEGYQDNWQEVGTERIARYPNLPPGDYTFNVKAANADGVWSTPIAQQITILPPWWKTWWAYLLYTLATIGTIFWYIRNLNRKLQKEQSHNKELTDLNTANQRFVPKDFLQILGKQSIKDLHLGDQTHTQMTILFSDIRSYTTLSEKMTPQENFNFINAYLGRVGPIIKAYGGFISQYMGDGFMALFVEDSSNAAQAAIAIQKELQVYNKERVAANKVPLKTGIGLNTGDLMLGVIGDEHRYESTVISDAVNTASRMEGLTKTFGAAIILSEKTLLGLKEENTLKQGEILNVSPDFAYRSLGKVKVKGKDKALKIYDLYEGESVAIRELKARTKPVFEQGISHYFNRQFGKSAECFKQVLELHQEDLAAQYYMDKSVGYIVDGVKEDWSGVEEMVMK